MIKCMEHVLCNNITLFHTHFWLLYFISVSNVSLTLTPKVFDWTGSKSEWVQTVRGDRARTHTDPDMLSHYPAASRAAVILIQPPHTHSTGICSLMAANPDFRSADMKTSSELSTVALTWNLILLKWCLKVLTQSAMFVQCVPHCCHLSACSSYLAAQ